MTRSCGASERFECFGSECVVLVTGDAGAYGAREAAERARRDLEAWHVRFSRFLPHSELSTLNGDPRESVPVSPMMARLARGAPRGLVQRRTRRRNARARDRRRGIRA